jgi:hypothetical protein
MKTLYDDLLGENPKKHKKIALYKEREFRCHRVESTVGVHFANASMGSSINLF